MRIEESAPAVAPAERRRAFEDVLHQLEQAIDAGALSAGDRLPAERELAAHFRVSRTSVREALRVLEALGIVQVRRGAENGATMLEEPGNALDHLLRFHLALGHVSVRDLVEFRILIESWAAAACARARDPELLSELEEAVARMSGAEQSRVDFNELDAAFHLTLVRGSGNELAVLVADGARGAIRRSMLDAILAVEDWPPTRRRLAREHRAIVEAIARGDEGDASKRTTDHVRRFWDTHLRKRADG
jgi:DNA-binding FadR family transcriptional regulator